MPKRPKSARVRIGDSAYYDPTTGQPSIDHNYQYLFLKAIEKRTPEVLTKLRNCVWPYYDSLYWRVVPPMGPSHWLYRIHPQLALSWISNKKPEDWTPRASRSLLALKRHLFSWSAQYQVHSDWMLMRAMDTMFYWTQTESDPERKKREHRFNREWKRHFGYDPAADPEADDDEVYSWDATRRWYFPADPEQHFVYAGWSGDAPQDYIQSVLAQFEAHLRGYLDAIKSKTANLPKTPILTKPERFEMLALYLCRNMTREEIRDAGFHKDLTVIFRDIQKAADLIGLTLRKPGKSRR